jgi:hypothetical protein
VIEQCPGLDADTVEVAVVDGTVVLRPAQQEASFPLQFGKWTFNNWEELAGFSANKAREITAGNGGDVAAAVGGNEGRSTESLATDPSGLF